MYKDIAKRRACQSRWREKHKERIRKYHREYRQRNRLLTRDPESLKRPHHCITCGVYLGEKSLSYRKLHSHCRSCGTTIGAITRLGEINPSNLCIKCDKIISPQSKHCWACHSKTRSSYIRTSEIRGKNRIARKKRWEDEEVKVSDMRKMARGQVKKPNKPERKLLEFLNEFYPNQWKFTGDGSFWVGKLNPDFIHTNSRKLAIDLFGNYWHNKAGLPPHKTELGRVMLMNAYGYKDLIIWDYELENTEAVKTKIDHFIHTLQRKEEWE